MGSWNVTCILTKTPILEGEECVLLRFHNPKGKEGVWLGDLDGFLDDYVPLLDLVHFGKYADYGRITGVKTDVCPLTQDKYYGFLVLKSAWDFCSKLDYDWVDEYVDQKLKMLKAHRQLSQLDKDPDGTVSVKTTFMGNPVKGALKLTPNTLDEWTAELVNFEKFEKELRVIGRLHAFARANLFNLFDISSLNMYAGQDWDMDEQKQWMKLRTKRIQDRIKLEESED